MKKSSPAAQARALATLAPADDMEEGSARRPLYTKVIDFIRQKMIEGAWRPGSSIPTEAELASMLGVSVGTVRKAIDALVAKRLITRRQGVGTFVSEIAERRALFMFFNLVDEDGNREVPDARTLSISRSGATAEDVAQLKVTRGSKVAHITRVRILQSEPRIVEHIRVSEGMFPNIGRRSDVPAHLFRFYELEYGVTVVRVRESIRALAAGAQEQEILRLPLGAPILEIDRLAFTLDGQVAEWRVSRCDTAHHRYVCERS